MTNIEIITTIIGAIAVIVASFSAIAAFRMVGQSMSTTDEIVKLAKHNEDLVAATRELVHESNQMVTAILTGIKRTLEPRLNMYLGVLPLGVMNPQLYTPGYSVLFLTNSGAQTAKNIEISFTPPMPTNKFSPSGHPYVHPYKYSYLAGGGLQIYYDLDQEWLNNNVEIKASVSYETLDGELRQFNLNLKNN